MYIHGGFIVSKDCAVWNIIVYFVVSYVLQVLLFQQNVYQAVFGGQSNYLFFLYKNLKFFQ